MNIAARITSRKVVYSYIYSYIIQRNPFNNPTWDTDIMDSNGTYLNDLEDISHDMSEDEIIDYCIQIVDSFFSYKRKPEVEMEFIKKMIKNISDIFTSIEALVDKYTTSFAFAKMDVADQALFILGVTEFTFMKTPKEVIINEMVEIWKRYGDKGSPKLVNWVLHKLLIDLELDLEKKKTA